MNGITGQARMPRTTSLHVETLESRDVPAALSGQASAMIAQLRTDVTKLIHDSAAALNNLAPVSFRQEIKHDLQALKVAISHRSVDAVFADFVKLGSDIQAQGGLSSLKSVWTNPTVRSDFNKLSSDGKAALHYFESQFLQGGSQLGLGNLFHGSTVHSIEQAFTNLFGHGTSTSGGSAGLSGNLQNLRL